MKGLEMGRIGFEDRPIPWQLDNIQSNSRFIGLRPVTETEFEILDVG